MSLLYRNTSFFDNFYTFVMKLLHFTNWVFESKMIILCQLNINDINKIKWYFIAFKPGNDIKHCSSDSFKVVKWLVDVGLHNVYHMANAIFVKRKFPGSSRGKMGNVASTFKTSLEFWWQAQTHVTRIPDSPANMH